ncbi:surface-adhesin E family protein [Roseateles sp. P5_D6]
MKLMLTTFALVFSSPAWADWEPIAANDEAIHFLDLQTVKTTGQIRRVWVLIDMKTPVVGRGNSQRSLAEYDCREERWRYLQSSDFSGQMGEGTILVDSSQPTAWRPVAPGTVGAAAIKLLCAPPPKRPSASVKAP